MRRDSIIIYQNINKLASMLINIAHLKILTIAVLAVLLSPAHMHMHITTQPQPPTYTKTQAYTQTQTYKQASGLQQKQGNGIRHSQQRILVNSVSESGPIPDKIEIYGVRWFLGDHFAYSNLYSTHKSYPNRRNNALNSNYYILAFNSDDIFDEDVYVEIQSTVHTCTHRRIEIDNSYDHDPAYEVVINSTLNNTVSDIYRCYINVDLSANWEDTNPKAPRAGNINKTNSSIWKEYPYTIYTSEPEFMYSKQTKDKIDPQTNKINRKITTQKVILFEGKFRAPVPVIGQEQEEKLSTDEKLARHDQKKQSQKFISIGDWGIIAQEIQKTRKYVPILQSMVAAIESDPAIVLVLFLGDLAYDIIGEKYIAMLKYIQPITSRICFMVTPGNHDYIYHEDSFELFAETFLSPQWDRYYNFYYTFVLGDVLFISYLPQNIIYEETYSIDVKPLEYIQKDLFNHYRSRVASGSSQTGSHEYDKVGAIPGGLDPIYKQYHVIVFSHYPIFCSKLQDGLRSCTQNINRFKQFIQIFDGIGMDMYISGHLHYYERTHAICMDTPRNNFTYNKPENTNGMQTYDDRCPVYVVEGAGGNDYWVEPEGNIKIAQYSGKVVEGTGFGVMELRTNWPEHATGKYGYGKGYDEQDQIEVTHYRMTKINQTVVADRFIKKLSMLSHYEKEISSNPYTYIDTDLVNVRVAQIVIVIVMIGAMSVICFCYGRVFVKDFGRKSSSSRKKTSEHVEMIEQNLNSVISEVKSNQNKRGTSDNEQEIDQDQH